MTIDEVFPNPTVKVVIFQARFPNLFYLEEKMGEFQIAIMEKYPQSKLLMQKKLFLADIGPEANIEDAINTSDGVIKKIWEFKSENLVKVQVTEDNIALTSEFHKTYRNESANFRFRDELEFVMGVFLDVFPLPRFTRVGLRYIDECPVPGRSNVDFEKHYNTAFPLNRFDLADACELQIRAVVQRGDHKLRYFEKYDVSEGEDLLIMDFDAFAENVPAGDYLKTTDKLHEIVSEEFKNSVKEPILEFMRGNTR